MHTVSHSDNILASHQMIYQRINSFPVLKYLYTYFYYATAAIQVIACTCLYPFFYPFFDGVNIFTYLFIAMTIIMLVLYIFETIVAYCSISERTFLNHYSTICSIFATLTLLTGSVLYSPIVGHQDDRQRLFIYAEAQFFIIEGIKVWLLYKQNKQASGSVANNKELWKSIFSCSSWILQLIGTVMFTYSIYVQKIIIIGVFLYGISSVFWAVSVWIYTSGYNLSDGRPCNLKGKEPQSGSLNELPQQTE